MASSGRASLRGRQAQPIASALARWSFPALIVAANLAVLHGFWLHPRLTNQQVDLLAHWLPRWCYLGRALAHGHVPTWLPYQFGGLPFASDPQSGWLSAPVMALFPFLSCGRALGLVIVANPLIAGLGLYLFGRNEGLGRPAAAVGGLTLSLGMAGSVVVLSMPFAAVLGWTAMALAGAAGYLRGRIMVRRLLWLGLAEFSLAQVATAHLTNGLAIAGIVLALYVLFVSVAQVRSGERTPGSAVGLALVPLLVFPFLAAAALLPRVAVLPRTSIGQGYLELARQATRLSGTPTPPPFARGGVSAWWGTAFARGPAGYLGAAAVLLSPVAFFRRRWRLPAVAFASAGFIGCLLNLDALVRWGSLRRFASRSSVGQLWLRDPYRFRYLLLLAVAALAAYGTQAWLEPSDNGHAQTLARRLRWLIPGLSIFVVLPVVAGSPVALYLSFAVGLALLVPLLALAWRGRTLAALALPVLVAGELSVSGLVVQASPVRAEPVAASPASPASTPAATDRFGHAFAGLRRPNIAPSAYLTPGDIGRTLVDARREGLRYLSFDPAVARTPRGFLDHQDPPWWPGYEDGRSVLFGIDEVQGYAAAQPARYWRLVRRIDPVPILYNASTLQAAPPQVLGLFAVGWIIERRGAAVPAGGTPVAAEGDFVLYRLEAPVPRASAIFAWRRLPADRALDAVLEPNLDPGREAVLETDPAVDGTPLISGGAGTGTVEFAEPVPEHARVRVTTDAPTVVVVRNIFDRSWTASMDGRPVPLIRADYLMQAVAVPAGTHDIDLRYRDRAIGYGLAVSAASWSIWVAALIGVGLANRRRGEAGPEGGGRPGAEPAGQPLLATPTRTGEP